MRAMAVKNMFRTMLGVLALVFVFAISPVLAADIHPELKKFQDEGGGVEFMGHDLGVDGWLITTPAGQRKYAYTTPEGGLIMGILVDKDGKIRTAEQIKAVQAKMAGEQVSMPGADKSGASKPERFYALVEKSDWVGFGSPDAPYVYMFMNITCDHCQKFWGDLREHVKSGLIQVRFIPFGQKDANRNTGAALLSVADPMAAWESYLKGDEKALSTDKITEGKMLRLDANTALFRDWKLGGPPLTVYRRPLDGKIMLLEGRPKNTMLLLADMIKKEVNKDAPDSGADKEAQDPAASKDPADSGADKEAPDSGADKEAAP